MVKKHRLAISLLVSCLAMVIATPALAAYWDYQGNLPMASGQRYYVKYTNASPGTSQSVRMSWTVGSHCMNFLKIASGGGWTTFNICGSDPWCISYYNCSIGILVDSIHDKFGCQNPPNLSTVYVNCRATNPL